MEPVLIISADERPTTRLLVELVAEGVRIAGFEAVVRSVERCPEDLAPFKLVFIGYQAPILFHQPLSQFLNRFGPKLRGHQIALFNTYSWKFGRYFFKNLQKKMVKLGIEPKHTLSFRRHGGLWALLGGGHLREEDLVRAKAFGERTSNTVYGVRIRKHSEKSRIKGYQK